MKSCPFSPACLVRRAFTEDLGVPVWVPSALGALIVIGISLTAICSAPGCFSSWWGLSFAVLILALSGPIAVLLLVCLGALSTTLFMRWFKGDGDDMLAEWGFRYTPSQRSPPVWFSLLIDWCFDRYMGVPLFSPTAVSRVDQSAARPVQTPRKSSLSFPSSKWMGTLSGLHSARLRNLANRVDLLNAHSHFRLRLINYSPSARAAWDRLLREILALSIAQQQMLAPISQNILDTLKIASRASSRSLLRQSVFLASRQVFRADILENRGLLDKLLTVASDFPELFAVIDAWVDAAILVPDSAALGFGLSERMIKHIYRAKERETALSHNLGQATVAIQSWRAQREILVSSVGGPIVPTNVLSVKRVENPVEVVDKSHLPPRRIPSGEVYDSVLLLRERLSCLINNRGPDD